METVRIRLLWHVQPQFAGYLIAAELGLARRRGVELVCEPIDFDDPGLDALADRRVQFAVSSPAHVLEHADSDAFALTLVIQQASPLVYPARRSSGIASLADLAGRPIGVWPGGEDLELRWAMQRSTGYGHAARHVPMTDTVGPFLEGLTDSAQSTCYHELHRVEQVMDADQLIVLKAEAVDAALIKDGLVARQDFLDARPELVQAVIDAVLEGWTRAFDTPGIAVDLCARLRPDMSRDELTRQMADIRTLSLQGSTLTKGLGFPDPLHVERARSALVELGEKAPDGPLQRFVADRFWQDCPSSWRRTEW